MYARLFSRRFRRLFCSGLLLFALGLRLLLLPGTLPLLRRTASSLGSRRILSALLLLSDLRAEPVPDPTQAPDHALSPDPAVGASIARPQNTDPTAEPTSSIEPAASDAADEQCTSLQDDPSTSHIPPPDPLSEPPLSTVNCPLSTANAALSFTAADADALELRGNCDYAVDPAALLETPLDWSAELDKPTVLILHSHSCEAYTQDPDDPYEASADFRTLDDHYNMLAVGDALADELQARAIPVLHDRSLHDYPSYNSSYADAKQQTEAFLAEYPSVVMVLDLHRDALDEPVREAVTLDGQDCARLMLVVGTDEGGLYHPFWPENLSCALKLQALLNRSCPGLMRPLNLRRERFNGQTSPGAMIVEVGSTGNSLAEAIRAMPYLADAVETLLRAQAAP